MKKMSVARRGLVWWIVGFAGLGWLLSGVVLAANATALAAEDAAIERFAQLDAAAEQVLNEVTALGAELVALEEARKLPLKTQLLVLVTVDPDAFFQLETVQLTIDENGASFHQYTQTELAALQQGGSHRLFWGSLPSGRHQLTLSVQGRASKDSDFQHESRLEIISGEGRRVVELRVSLGKNQPLPEVSLKDWK